MRQFDSTSTNLNSKLRKNMAISGICKPISIIVSYLYVPVVLNYLGIEKYGIWSVILTILSWITYFDIGIGNGLRNRLTESVVKHDAKGEKLVSSAYMFVTMIMIIALTLFSLIAYLLNWERIFGVDSIQENLRAVVITSAVFVALNFILSLCKNILYAHQQPATVSIMELVTQVLNIAGVFAISFYVKGRLFVLVLVYGLSMLIVSLSANVIIFCIRKDLRPSIKSVDLYVGKDLTTLGVNFFVIQICYLILFTTDSVIISYLYGASDVTPYSTVNKLFSLVISIFSALLVPIWGDVTRAKTKGEWKYICYLTKKMYYLSVPFIIGTVFLIFQFRFISDIWLGVRIDYPVGMIPLGGIYCILTIWCNTHSYFTNGMEILREPKIIGIIQAIINIPLSLFFAEVLKMQATGVLLGTVVTMFIPVVALPIIVWKQLIKERGR